MCCHKGKSEFLKSTQKFFSLTWKQLSMIRGVCVLFFLVVPGQQLYGLEDRAVYLYLCNEATGGRS